MEKNSIKIFNLLHFSRNKISSGTEWFTSMSRTFSRNCRYQLSYAMKNQLVGSLWHKGAYNRTFPCNVHGSHPSLCHKEPARGFGCNKLVLYCSRELVKHHYEAPDQWEQSFDIPRPMRVDHAGLAVFVCFKYLAAPSPPWSKLVLANHWEQVGGEIFPKN